MPCIETIKGIRICVYSNDHVPPHIHAIYGEYEALIDIRELLIIAGSLPANKRKMVIAYVQDNQKDILETFYELNPNLRII